MDHSAIILTGGILNTPNAKTAHGLIRESKRFHIAAVVDENFAGQDAGFLLDGQRRNLPVIGTLEEAVNQFPQVRFCIIGVATVGGVIPENLRVQLRQAITLKLSIVNGMHDHLSNHPDFVELAAQYEVELIDIRKPKKREDLHFWTGEIFQVSAPIIAVLGMDCAMGKRTTTRLVMNACRDAGMNAQMIYTGQTGWLQGEDYGFILDATLNDFISGELEHAISSCWKETKAQVILLEGQSALRNPSGPCGSEYLLSGNAKQVILMAAPKRKYFEDDPAWGPIPDIESEIQLIELYGSRVMAIALHTEHCSIAEALSYQKEWQERLKIPVLLPLETGVDALVPMIQNLIKK